MTIKFTGRAENYDYYRMKNVREENKFVLFVVAGKLKAELWKYIHP